MWKVWFRSRFKYRQWVTSSVAAFFLIFSYPVGQCFSDTPMYFVISIIVFGSAQIHLSHSSLSVEKLNTVIFSSVPQYIHQHFLKQRFLGISLFFKFHLCHSEILWNYINNNNNMNGAIENSNGNSVNKLTKTCSTKK